MSNRPVFWGRSGAIPVAVQNGSTTGLGPGEREAYLAGWRDAREAAANEVIEGAKIFDTSVFIGPPRPSSIRKAQDVAHMIRAISEPEMKDD